MTLWVVTGLLFNVEEEPYDVVVPYSTCVEDASWVVQVIVACVLVRLPALIPEIAGAVESSVIVSE